VDELLNRAIELAKADYNLKKKCNINKVKFLRQYENNVPELSCVPMEIEQVVINLIKNSCQAMAAEDGPAAPQIIIRLAHRKDKLIIELEDNGPGIAPDARDHIFDPFFTTKDVGEGTGLGLYVSYTIIHDKHGGNLEISSPVGKGTLCTITLPLYARQDEGKESAPPAPSLQLDNSRKTSI